MTRDLLTRLAGSNAFPPVAQSIAAATAAAGLLSEHFLDLRGPRAEDTIARSFAEGNPLGGVWTIGTSVDSATLTLTVDLQLITIPRTTLTMPTFLDAAVSAANDTITIAAHGFPNGTVLTLSTSGVLPAGLALATHYYVRNATTDTFQLSLTPSPGAAIVDITAAAGGGTHTATFLPTVVASSGPVPRRRLQAGDRVPTVTNPLLESGLMPKHRYLFGFVKPSANLTAGTTFLDFGELPDRQVNYRAGVTT